MDKTVFASIQYPFLHQIIQLVEIPAPPPRISGSDYSSFASSSSSSWSSEDGYEEEYESECTSYRCSDDGRSVARKTGPEVGGVGVGTGPADGCCSGTMNRVFAWREAIHKEIDIPTTMATSLTKSTSHNVFLAPPPVVAPPSSIFSEPNAMEDGQPTPMPELTLTPPSLVPSITIRSCAACDATFSSPGDLFMHGAAKGASEACRAAVEYHLERTPGSDKRAQTYLLCR